jgi:hypothetical protein
MAKKKNDLCEQLVHFTTGAVLLYFTLLVIVFVAQEVISQQRIVHKGLENDIHEASLTEVEKSPSAWAN